MDADLTEVLASYHRCRECGLFDTFYDILLAKSPEVRERFAQTDFAVQRRMLKQSVLTMLLLGSGSDEAHQEVCRLGESHSRHGHDVQPELYDLWLDALCEAVRRHDPEYRAELDQMWREAMQPGIDLMTSTY